MSSPSLAAESMKTCVGLGLIHTHTYAHMNKYTHTHTRLCSYTGQVAMVTGPRISPQHAAQSEEKEANRLACVYRCVCMWVARPMC